MASLHSWDDCHRAVRSIPLMEVVIIPRLFDERRTAEQSVAVSPTPGRGRHSDSLPHRFRHVIFFGLFFILTFGIFGYPFWYLMRVVLPSSISFVYNSSFFSPVIADSFRIDYLGFGIPLVIATISVIGYYARTRGGNKFLSRGFIALLIVTPVSVLLSQYTSLGVFVSLGLTDPILLFAFSFYLYDLTLHRSRVQAALASYPTGFILGFLSDLGIRQVLWWCVRRIRIW